MVGVVQGLKGVCIAFAHPLHQSLGVIGHAPTVRFIRARTLSWYGNGVVGAADAQELVKRLREAQSVLALTGSGISAESGLPTFRGVGGLWRSHRVEELASPDGFARDPRLVWTWYNERLAAHARAEPNAGHRALVALERRYRDFSVATQNVDSLHRRAGSQTLYELHGNLRAARCTNCDARRPLDASGLPLEEIEHSCGGRMRPNIVWFGEALPKKAWSLAAEAAARAEVILVIGTSAVVYPAASLARSPHAFVVEINPESTAVSQSVNIALRYSAAEVLPTVVEMLSE